MLMKHVIPVGIFCLAVGLLGRPRDEPAYCGGPRAGSNSGEGRWNTNEDQSR